MLLDPLKESRACCSSFPRTFLEQYNTSEPIIKVPEIDTAHTTFVITDQCVSVSIACVLLEKSLGFVIERWEQVGPRYHNRPLTALCRHPLLHPCLFPSSSPSHLVSRLLLHHQFRGRIHCSTDFASYRHRGCSHRADNLGLFSGIDVLQAAGRPTTVGLRSIEEREHIFGLGSQLLSAGVGGGEGHWEGN